jgi:hypothetical protein
LTPPAVQIEKGLDIQSETARRQSIANLFEVIAEEGEIVHS